MSDESQQPDEALIAQGRRALRELADATPAMLRNAESVFPRAPSVLARIQALLSLDSWATPLPALRASDTGARQLLFTTETRDIDLRILPGREGWTLEGQVLGPADEGTLGVRRAGEPVTVAALDELGAFRVEGLAAGRYELILYFATERVELPEVDVKAQDAP